MLLHLARLERDLDIPKQPFGVIGKIQYGHLENQIAADTERACWQGSDYVGAVISDIRDHPIVKLTSCTTDKRGRPVIVEHTCLEENDRLLPFRVKQRGTDTVARAVFPHNLTALHRKVGGPGSDVWFIDPRSAFIYNAVSQGGESTDPAIAETYQLFHEYIGDVNIVRDDMLAKDVTTQEKALAAVSHIPYLVESDLCWEDMAAAVFEPPLLTPDTVSSLAMTGSRSVAKSLLKNLMGRNPLDLSPPQPINYKDRHLGSAGNDMYLNAAAEILDLLPFTDLDVRYVVNKHGISACETKLVDRHAPILGHFTTSVQDREALDRVIGHLIFPMSVWYGSPEFQLHLVKTHHDEIVIELSDMQGRPQRTEYLDLTRLSMCSMGAVAVTTD